MPLWERPTRGQFERLKDAMETLDDRVSAVKGRQRTVDAKLGSLTQRCTRLENKQREVLAYLNSLHSAKASGVGPDDVEPEDEEGEALDINERRLKVAARGE